MVYEIKQIISAPCEFRATQLTLAYLLLIIISIHFITAIIVFHLRFMFHFFMNRIINNTMHTQNNLALAMYASGFDVSVISCNRDDKDY